MTPYVCFDLPLSFHVCDVRQKRLDEAVLNALREKYADKMARMGRGDEGSFDELFTYACPKFITASPPSYDAPTNTFQEVRALCAVGTWWCAPKHV